MPDISQMTSDLRGLPDQVLQHELMQPSGVVPSYLVLAEAQRRQLMRQAAQKQQSQGQSGTVMDDVVRNMMAGQPSQDGPPPPAGMTPPKAGQGPPQQGPPGMPGAAPPQQMGFARGGVIQMADGDLYEDDGEGEDQPDQPQVQAQGSADRAMQPVNVDDLAEAMIQFEGSRKPDSPGYHANNPGHLKYVGQKGSIGKDALGFARFNDWNTGLTAMKDQIRTNLKRGLTLSEMIGGKEGVYPGWAPASDNNNPANYINYLKKQTGYDPDALMQEGGAQAAPKPPVLAASQADQGPATGPVQGSADTPTEKPVPKLPPAVEEETDGEDGDGEAAAPPAPPAKPAAPSYVMPSAREFDPYNPANIDKQRQLYYTIFGGSPERQQQLEAQRAATVAQLQGLQQDTINRYRNPSPWEFLANIGAGMGASHQLSLPLMFAQGVGQAWQARDQQQDRALTQAEALQQHIDAIQNIGGTERERMGRDLVTLLGQQSKTPGGAAKFEDFVKMPGATYGSIDPSQAPGPGMIGVPDPGHPGFGVWISQNQATQAPKGQQLTGMFEKDFLPGWAEENGTSVDKMTGTQRQQAFKDYRASLVDPSIKEAAQEIAKGIMEGTSPPDMKGLYRYGGQVRAILNKNGYDLTTAMRDWQNLQKYYTTLNGAKQIQMRQSTQFVAESIPYMRQLYKDWQATGLPTGFKEYNKAALVAATNLPGEQGVKARLLLSQLSHMTSEVGTMYKGGNNSTDDSLRLAGESLQADWNPEQFMGALGQLEKNVQLRRNSWNSIAPAGVSPDSQYLVKPGGGAGGAGPTAGNAPPRPAGIPAGAAAQWNPTRQQWRYKKPGSDTWQILQ
ncbi:MAG TPA: hypothetical protein VNW90_25175 [Acetobacteraceae bacterium]|jgi:hypothetical protein|nr:hypothetical protein [Acetobacteraceae bacterium]